jgi:integrase/recombinase XerD
MRLHALVNTYITYKRSLGMRMHTEARELRFFCNQMGDIELTQAEPHAVLDFVGDVRKPGRWRVRYWILSSFYRYALEREFVKTSPLPPRRPNFPAQTPPYIYSTAELERLLAAAAALPSAYYRLQPDTYHTLLLLLYGSAIRIGEALALSLRDVDLIQGVLTIRETKFFKHRLVPIGPKLRQVLHRYVQQRRALPLPEEEASCFFCNRSGRSLHHNEVGTIFRRLRTQAGIRRRSGPRSQPRLHDIRHTSATHRLITWYREGQDVQQLLPYLATYLGHRDLESTQRYLTLTPELLAHASARFHRCLQPENRRV